MTRYWLWNYAGREGWVQDDGANIAPLNILGNIFGKIIAVRFEGNISYSLFGVPFLIGLFGIYYHFRRDWKMASIFMVMFILLGYLTAFYQNQQQPQPRERDYFYVGAFFVFSIWIAIGVRGLVDLVQKKIKKETYGTAAVLGVLIFTFVLIPVECFRLTIILMIVQETGSHGIIHIIFYKALHQMVYYLQMEITIHFRFGIFRMLRG
jgi:hypothetical protein